MSTFCITGPLWGESTSSSLKWPVMQIFGDFIVFRQLRLLNKQLSCHWFVTPWSWCDATVMHLLWPWKTDEVVSDYLFVILQFGWCLACLQSIIAVVMAMIRELFGHNEWLVIMLSIRLGMSKVSHVSTLGCILCFFCSRTWFHMLIIIVQWPLLLTWFNFNPSMDK